MRLVALVVIFLVFDPDMVAVSATSAIAAMASKLEENHQQIRPKEMWNRITLGQTDSIDAAMHADDVDKAIQTSGVWDALKSNIRLSDDMLMGWIWVMLAVGVVCALFVVHLAWSVISRFIGSVFGLKRRKNSWLSRLFVDSGPFTFYQHIAILLFAIAYGVQKEYISVMYVALQVILGKMMHFFLVEQYPAIAGLMVTNALDIASERFDVIEEKMRQIFATLPKKADFDLAIEIAKSIADTITYANVRLKVLFQALNVLATNMAIAQLAAKTAADTAKTLAATVDEKAKALSALVPNTAVAKAYQKELIASANQNGNPPILVSTDVVNPLVNDPALTVLPQQPPAQSGNFPASD